MAAKQTHILSARSLQKIERQHPWRHVQQPKPPGRDAAATLLTSQAITLNESYKKCENNLLTCYMLTWIIKEVLVTFIGRKKHLKHLFENELITVLNPKLRPGSESLLSFLSRLFQLIISVSASSHKPCFQLFLCKKESSDRRAAHFLPSMIPTTLTTGCWAKWKIWSSWNQDFYILSLSFYASRHAGERYMIFLDVRVFE